MNDMNKVKITVAGTEYTLVTPEAPAYVQELAVLLNNQLKELMSHNASLSLMSAVVLTSINYLDESKKASQDADNLRSQIRDYLQDAAKARIEADEAKRENVRLIKELETLKKG